PTGAGDLDAGGVGAGVVGVEEGGLVVGPGVPACPVQQPAAVGQGAVAGLERLHFLDRQQVSGVGGGPGGVVGDPRRAGEGGRRDLADVVLVLAGDPVDGGVEVGAGVLAPLEGVPVPGRPALVIVGQLPEPEPGRVGERLG